MAHEHASPLETVSAVAQDYLKVVWNAQEWSETPLSVKELAARLGVTAGTVSEGVRKLAGAGLIDHARYGQIALTAQGRRAALAVVRRHRLVETLLVETFGYSWDEVHDEAEVLEHAISDRLLEGISARLGHPMHDPHGDAIPDASGAVVREPFVLLGQAQPGHSGRVLRVSDRDPALLRALEGAGIDVGHHVTAADDGTVRVDGGATVELPAGAASAVWITA